MIKLCYKQYPYKLTLGADKAFRDQTGLDLQTVFMDYIAVCHKTTGMELMERLVFFSKLYTRDIASKALHAVISAKDESIPLAEIEDATFRVSWMQTERIDGMSEPWPMVMLDAALMINQYIADNINVKKPDTLADTKAS